MLRITRSLIPLAAALALVPAVAAQAKTATFTATFEATRDAEWKQPRGVSLKDCNGEHYWEGWGSLSQTIKSRKPFKVKVQSFVPGTEMWTFGKGVAVADPRDFGIESNGPNKREATIIAGTTGGWCGGGEQNDPKKNDCGTRLPTYNVILSAALGKMTWTAGYAPQMRNEKLEFYDCLSITPEGMPEDSFPNLDAKYRSADVFNRKKGTLVIKAHKSFGPSTWPVANLGVDRTASGTVDWKLTLKRVK